MGFWAEHQAHTRLVAPDTIKTMLCMHGGSFDDCIEKVDDWLHDLYLCDDPEWLAELKKPPKKTRQERKAISLRPRELYVYGREGVA